MLKELTNILGHESKVEAAKQWADFATIGKTIDELFASLGMLP
jgi:hypothetical protein